MPAFPGILLLLLLSRFNPIDGNPPGSSVPGILQARILEWVAVSFSVTGILSCVKTGESPSS